MAKNLKSFYRPLGKTGINVSPLGLGTVKFGRTEKVKYPTPFDLPNDKALAGLLDEAKSLGINLIDTAPSYGIAEERLGKILKGQRADWVIAGKAGEQFNGGVSHYDFSADGIRASVENSLRALQTDYLDVLLLHATAGDEGLCKDDALLKTLSDLKSSGKIRAVGLSSYSVEAGLIGAEIFDVLMVGYNLGWRAEEPVINKCAAHTCGVLVKKAFNSGNAVHGTDTDVISDTFKLLFSHSAIASAIVGTINPDHLRENVAKLMSVLP
jgi:aryl-alcohol dehydrogenase-like predicted oxidoreductase